MIVRCRNCRRVRIDPESVRLVLDNDIACEAWADPLDGEGDGDCWVGECPLCERQP